MTEKQQSAVKKPEQRRSGGADKKHHWHGGHNSGRRFNAPKSQHQPTGAPKAPGRESKFNLPQRAMVGAHQSAVNKLRIIPLGGMEEVGRNMTIFEYGDDILILDMGIQFPEDDTPGVDYIIPNIDYLKGKENKIRAVVFSHGHLDHIGAAPILLERLGYPTIVARPLTIAMIKHRQDDYKPQGLKSLKIAEIKTLQDTFKFGVFKIKFFQIEHSIMDAVGLVIETPVISVVHLGDWTLEKDDNGKATIDYSFLSRLPRPIVLMSESLGVIDVRTATTTPTMQRNMIKILTEAKGRVIIGTFSSQIERIEWIISTAERLGKKVAIDGYSMKLNVEIAKELGYIKLRKGTLIKVDEVSRYPDDKLVVIVTGAQGESNAVFSRIITGSHRNLKIKKSDTVLFSSSIIPGNERNIQKLKDNIYRQSDHVIHGEIMDIHVSGHANREDNVQVLRQIRPDYYIPVYAYHYMLVEAAKLAKSIGFPEKNIFVLDNGQVAEFDTKGGRATTERALTDYVFVDGLGVGDVSHVVLRDRQLMAADGMLVVIITLRKKTGELVQNPDLISRGFIHMKENKKLVEETRKFVRALMKEGDHNSEAFENYIKNKVRNDVGEFLWKKTERRPMILPVLIEV
ncbi:MAG: ribonuclease J [Patescibacteria group bacterium]|jgi:ribonuclease J